MALRIPWDEYESALLLSELLRVLNGETTRKDAVKSVSQTLRQRAVARGIEIDDIFRYFSERKWNWISNASHGVYFY